MKTIKPFSVIITCLFLTFSATAQQVRSDSFKVQGECGMCKKKIENAAKKAGATYAEWSPVTKTLNVSYNTSLSSVAVLQQAIAKTGYYTPGYKATEEAYNALDECCKYERQASKEISCAETCASKDTKCAETACCEGKGRNSAEKNCCKKS